MSYLDVGRVAWRPFIHFLLLRKSRLLNVVVIYSLTILTEYIVTLWFGYLQKQISMVIFVSVAIAVGCCIIDLGKMAEKLVPVVRADEEEAEEEELVDPQQQLREVCSQKPDAQNLWSKYQECNNRVTSRSKTAETCEEELIDYIHVLDKCVNKDLFKRLK